MDVVLSPYHLTTREPAAMAAFLLARRAVTILPVPPSGETRASLESSLAHSPRYHRLLSSWLELAPLFAAGVITTLARGQDAIDDARAAAARIDGQRAYEPLRAFVHDDAIASNDDSLDAFSADLLKGGPDPGLSLPAVAGLDALAVRHGMLAIRAGAASGPAGMTTGSLTQQAESRLGRTLLTFGMPILSQASPRTILRARRDLAEPLAALQTALQAFAANTDAPTSALATSARAAASSLAQAFKQHISPHINKDDDRRKRVTELFVSIQLRAVPVESALIAALAAAARAGAASAPGSPQPAAPTTPNAPTAAPAERLLTLVVTPTNVTLSPTSASPPTRTGARS